MRRAPVFRFADLRESTTAALWVRENVARLRAAAEATSRHARLLEIGTTIEGNHLYLDCAYATGEAAGQNMVDVRHRSLVRGAARARAGAPALVRGRVERVGRQEGRRRSRCSARAGAACAPR